MVGLFALKRAFIAYSVVSPYVARTYNTYQSVVFISPCYIRTYNRFLKSIVIPYIARTYENTLYFASGWLRLHSLL